MGNRDVTYKNFRKFRHAKLCGCVECRFNTVKYRPPGERINDYFNEEEFVDENGWF